MADVANSKIILDYALAFLGVPYVWGGSTFDGVDCSGLVLEVLKARGVMSGSLDMTAQDLFLRTASGGVLRPEAHALAFFGKNNIATHVGYCINDNLMVEAGGGSSTCTNRAVAEKLGAFVRLRPVFHRKDYLACHIPERSHFA